jgi:hypothetical protein
MLLVGAGGTPMLDGRDFWVSGPLVLLAIAGFVVWFIAGGHGRTSPTGSSYAT